MRGAGARGTCDGPRATGDGRRATGHVRPHVAHRTSHVAHRTSHVARRTSHLARGTPHLAPGTSHVPLALSHARGTIPAVTLDLRPLTIGELFDRAFMLYRRHFLLFVGITAVPGVFALIMMLAQQCSCRAWC